MTNYVKPTFGNREQLGHRMLYYLNKRTSISQPEWRDATIGFFFQLFELSNDRPSLNLLFQRSDGLWLYSGSPAVAYIYFYQKHFLIHAKEDFLVWAHGDRLFETQHVISFPRMWKETKKSEIQDFLEFLNAMPALPLPTDVGANRSIPTWVQSFVYEPDGGKCCSCNSKINLCFDHILPFCKGGSSDHPNSLQLLCAKCNLAKGTHFWPVKL